MKVAKQKINQLAKAITVFVQDAKAKTAVAVNKGILYTYWHTGKLIVELEKQEQYDDVSTRQLLIDLSAILTAKLGSGFSRNQLIYMRLFYMRFHAVGSKKKNGLTLSDQISWSHYIELLKVEYDEGILFYSQIILSENLSVRELRNHIKKALFERVVLSKSKKQLPLPVAAKNKNVKQSINDFYRDPVVLEFLNITSSTKLTEKKLEQSILDNLQLFILELGKGFAFVERQCRMAIDGNHYRVDLVFYHYILKCFVIIDLKIDGLQHQDIGQMNMYLNYFKAERNNPGDNAPIGIILTNDQGNLTVEYALGGISNNIFVRKYQLYLPDKKLLENRIKQFFANKKSKK